MTTGSFSTNRDIVLNTTGTFTQDAVGSVFTVNGVVSGNGGLTQAGPGKLVLTGNNTYAGGTSFMAARLSSRGSNTALGTGLVTGWNNATLQILDGVTVSNQFDLEGLPQTSVSHRARALCGSNHRVWRPRDPGEDGRGTLVISNNTNNFSAGARINEGALQVTRRSRARTGNDYPQRRTLQAGANVDVSN